MYLVLAGAGSTNAFASFIMLPHDDSYLPSYGYQFSFQLDANKYRLVLLFPIVFINDNRFKQQLQTDYRLYLMINQYQYADIFNVQYYLCVYSICLKLAPCSDQQCSSLHPPKKPRQTTDWLKKHLMHKLITWTEQQYMSRLNNKKQLPMTMSLSLVEKEDYATLYQKLKLKYGKKWIEVFIAISNTFD